MFYLFLYQKIRQKTHTLYETLFFYIFGRKIILPTVTAKLIFHAKVRES